MIVIRASVIAWPVGRETCVIVRPIAPIIVPAMEVANVTEPVPVIRIGGEPVTVVALLPFEKMASLVNGLASMTVIPE